MARAGTATAPRTSPGRTSTPRAPARRKSGPAAPPRKPATTRTRTASKSRKRAPAVSGALSGPLATVAAAPRTALKAATSGALLDRLLRGRGWVVCVGVLLAGIVFFNVSLLELNSGITRTSAKSSALKRENAQLRARVAELGSSERIQRLAEARGMYLPAPGDVNYGRSDFEADGRRAARRLRESSQLATGTTGTTTPTTTPVAPAPVAEAPAPVTPVEPAPEPTAQVTPAPADPTAGTGG